MRELWSRIKRNVFYGPRCSLMSRDDIRVIRGKTGVRTGRVGVGDLVGGVNSRQLTNATDQQMAVMQIARLGLCNISSSLIITVSSSSYQQLYSATSPPGTPCTNGMLHFQKQYSQHFLGNGTAPLHTLSTGKEQPLPTDIDHRGEKGRETMIMATDNIGHYHIGVK